MRDEQDPVIRRLFAEQEKSRPVDDFILELSERIDARERVRRLYGVLAVVLGLALAALSAPWIAQATSMLIELTAAALSGGGPLLRAPLAWMVLAATAVGWSPVIYLWRTSRW